MGCVRVGLAAWSHDREAAQDHRHASETDRPRRAEAVEGWLRTVCRPMARRALALAALLAGAVPAQAEPVDLRLPAGALLTFAPDAEPAGLNPDATDEVAMGRGLFFRDWYRSAATGVGTPLGPHFDAVSCAGCHAEIAAPGAPSGPPVVKPVALDDRQRFAGQINHFAVPPMLAEALTGVRSSFRVFRLRDGTVQLARMRTAEVTTSGGAPVPATLRATPVLLGWGLLENADERMLAVFEDATDSDGDGISGRRRRLDGAGDSHGMFGWKGGVAGLETQVASALYHDMGLTTDGFTDGGTPEVDAASLSALAAYVRQIGVPDRRPATAESQRGAVVFGTIGCDACHVPVLLTAPHPDPALSEQVIWPFTDLMLHDMGPALAAGTDADAREWRTAPLWGLGWVKARRPGHGFLHDGRAQTMEEAVLWHGGEAARARERFVALSSAERAALLAYLTRL